MAPVSWTELARALGAPPFADFALAVTLAANGMDGSQRNDADRDLIARLMGLVSHLSLDYPEDAVLPDALRPQVRRILDALGCSEFVVWDEHRPDYRTYSTTKLDELVWSGTWLSTSFGYPRPPTSIADPDERFVMSTFPMDTYYSVVGITAPALDRLGGELGLEGFWVGSETPFDWVNEPGTYSYPDWLRETTGAA
jgi:hypothetical protein